MAVLNIYSCHQIDANGPGKMVLASGAGKLGTTLIADNDWAGGAKAVPVEFNNNEEENVKKMKTLDAVKIIDIAGVLIQSAMLAAIAILANRFIRMYLGVCINYITIYIQPLFTCAYARKRVLNRNTHDCKNATFPINPDSRARLSGK